MAPILFDGGGEMGRDMAGESQSPTMVCLVVLCPLVDLITRMPHHAFCFRLSLMLDVLTASVAWEHQCEHCKHIHVLYRKFYTLLHRLFLDFLTDLVVLASPPVRTFPQVMSRVFSQVSTAFAATRGFSIAFGTPYFSRSCS